MSRWVEIGADQALRGRGFLDLGDEREAVLGLGLQRGAEAAGSGLLSRPCVEDGQRRQQLARGDFLALGGADLGEFIGHFSVAIQQSSSVLASPLSSASAASSTPARQSLTSPATSSAPAALNSTASRYAPVSPSRSRRKASAL